MSSTTTQLPKMALLVGINYINTPYQLQGCIDDVSNMRNFLIDTRGYSTTNVTMLRDDLAVGSKSPTRANIITSLTNLIANSTKYSEIWFLYSGHGSQIKEKVKGSEITGMDQMIIPIDAIQSNGSMQVNNIILDNEIYNIIKNSKCPTIMMFDSCHSGSVCDLKWYINYDISKNKFSTTSINSAAISNPNIIVFSGCKDTQTSADSFSQIQQIAVGAFTNAFLESMRANGHNVTLLQLYKDTCINLSQNGFSQSPVLSSSSQNPSFSFTRALNIGAPKDIMSSSTMLVSNKKAIVNNMLSVMSYKI
jgi:hypothetical protein